MTDARYVHELAALAREFARAFPAVHAFAWEDWKPDGESMVSPGGRRLSRATYERLSTARGPDPSRQAPSRGAIRSLRPDQIAVDPARFQFKARTDPKTGAGRELAGVAVFNPELAGVIAVWRDPADGKTYVVNGHHRLDLARRAGARRIAARYVTAASAEEARAKGALINIAEGRGTAVDAAKFLRDSGTTVDALAAAGVSLAGPVARDAVTLSNLDAGLFHKVALGVLDVPRALAVAAHLPDHADQRTLLGFVDRQEERTGREMSPAAVAEAAKEMAATPRATVAGPGDSLFGNDPEEESIFLQRAELKAFVRRELARQAKDYGLLGSRRRVASTAGVGNVIDPARNKLASEEARSLVEDFDRAVNRSGAVSDVVNRHAARLANAHTPALRDRVLREALESVRAAVRGRGFESMSEWVRELHPFWTFAWKQGKRGGRYWLPDGKPDARAHRLYGTRAERAAAAEGKGAQKAHRPAAASKGSDPAPAQAQAKYEVARDAFEAASQPDSGMSPQQVEWFRRRMEAARAQAGGKGAQAAPGAATAPKAGEVLTPEDKAELERRRSLMGRIGQWAWERWKTLQEEFGTAGAFAVIGTAAAPVPGTILAAPVVGKAVQAVDRGVRAAGRAVGIGGSSPPEPKRQREKEKLRRMASEAADRQAKFEAQERDAVGMSRAEFVAKHGNPREASGYGKEHERLVRAAVRRGESVPDRVLLDYPDLHREVGDAAVSGRTLRDHLARTHPPEAVDAVLNAPPSARGERLDATTGSSLQGFAANDAKRHREAVKRQLAAGKPVPPEVLADYPDLTPPPETKRKVAPESAPARQNAPTAATVSAGTPTGGRKMGLKNRPARHGNKFEVQQDVGPGRAKRVAVFDTMEAAYRDAAGREGMSVADYTAALEGEAGATPAKPKAKPAAKADPKAVEGAAKTYERLRDLPDGAVSVEGARAEMTAALAAMPKAQLDEVMRRLSFTPERTAKAARELLVENLLRIRMQKLAASRVGSGA